jgi:hypothetical protein
MGFSTCYRFSNTSSSIGGAEWGRTVRSAGPSPGPSARSRGCSRYSSASRVWRSASPSRIPCSASTTRVSPGRSGVVRSTAAASVPRPPGSWRGTPRPSIPAGRPPTSCCGRIRTSAGGSCTAAVHRRRADPYRSTGGACSSSSIGSSSWSWPSWWSTIRRISAKPKAARNRRRAASWSGSTSTVLESATAAVARRGGPPGADTPGRRGARARRYLGPNRPVAL